MRQQSSQKNSGNLCHVSHLLINKHFQKQVVKTLKIMSISVLHFNLKTKNQGDQCSKGISMSVSEQLSTYLPLP